jgi:hypothetical protein
MRFALVFALAIACGILTFSPTAPAAEIAPVQPTTRPSSQENLPPLLAAIRDARDPSGAVDAYGKALAGGADSLSAERVYLIRMADFSLPEMADSQSQDLILRDPENGLAWAVAAHMSARRGSMAAALGQIETAASRAPNDPFVLRTAGNVFAWYDSRGAGVDIPDVIRAPIPDIKNRMRAQPAFAMAYDDALDDYKNAPATQPAQAAETAATEPYTAPPAYPVASAYPYQVAPTYYYPAYYPSYGYYSDYCPDWYPIGSRWCGFPFFGASFIFVDGFHHDHHDFHDGHHDGRFDGHGFRDGGFRGGRDGIRDSGFRGSRGGGFVSDGRGSTSMMPAPSRSSAPPFVGPTRSADPAPTRSGSSPPVSGQMRGRGSMGAAPAPDPRSSGSMRTFSVPSSGGGRSSGGGVSAPSRGGGGGSAASRGGGGGRR